MDLQITFIHPSACYYPFTERSLHLFATIPLLDYVSTEVIGLFCRIDSIL